MENATGNAVMDMQELTVAPEMSGSEYGRISINPNVFAIIAHETAKEVPGVVELQGSLADGIAGIIGKKAKDKGIRVEEERDLLTVNLTVVLEFGVNIPEICLQLQAAVKKSIEEMTGKEVYAVNVVVQGIRNSRTEKKALEE
ncbi:Asp23/Gls24 family envelope stress response protein [Pontiella agarivorans]|uniref:Asp23/Gls24 family envelope stress response protein n=1 Tax=Pontiella agarivorans TaxID=3038953 RepID=A0ABU5MZA2_9BACT|nr:Asp23/Gls24 family envelope stress response protein [Pontiella agarivorans]MDZ8119543.1 Asp23/Gls24 family envelope stress response protein [Pontiella agarivorans]